MSMVLWEGIPNVGSKARESAKAMSLCCWIFSMRVSKEERQATLYVIRSEMGSQCSFFSRRSVEWWWRGAKRTSLAAKF